MVVTPWSIEARIAAIESASSFPPHIQPPTAHAPKITGVTVTSEPPSRLFSKTLKIDLSQIPDPEGRDARPVDIPHSWGPGTCRQLLRRLQRGRRTAR